MARGERGTAAYRRRRPLPAIAIAVVLGITAVVLWSTLLHQSGQEEGATKCNPPTVPAAGAGAGKQPGKMLPANALDNIDPAAPQDVPVTVLNGSDQRGEATLVSATLEELGFTRIGDPDNDPLYPDSNLDCRGEIRFGPNGAAAARTLSLIEPCVALIRDNRQDGSVDLSLGSEFDDLSANQDGRRAIAELQAGGGAPTGGQQAEQGAQSIVDPATLKRARDVSC